MLGRESNDRPALAQRPAGRQAGKMADLITCCGRLQRLLMAAAHYLT